MALEQACMEGRVADVKRLLAGGQSARASENLGVALANASGAGHLDVVEVLLAAGAAADIFSTGRGEYHTAECSIVAACHAGHLAVVDRLMTAIATCSESPGLIYARRFLLVAMDRAIEAGHVEVLERLVALRVRVNLRCLLDAARMHPRNMRLLSLLVSRQLCVPDDDSPASSHIQRDVALVCASHRGDLGAVDAALADGADANVGDGIALALACAGGQASAPAALRLIAAGVSATTAQRALNGACERGIVDVVTALLRAGAAPANDYWPLLSACENGHTQTVTVLLAAGPGADRITEALPSACAHGHHAIVRMLLAAGADARHDNSKALAAACQEGWLAICVELLAAGADINVSTALQQSDYPAAGVSPFFCACMGNHLDVAKLLLAHGADIHTFDDAGLGIACSYGFVDLVDWLIKSGANVNAGDGAPLRRACASGWLTVVNRLLQAGANVNACGAGYTRRGISGPKAALTVAADNGRTLDRLLEARADVHAVDDAALRLACREGFDEVVRMLISAGANVHALDDEAVREASRHGFVRIVERLLEAGADATQVHWAALHPDQDWPECVMRIRRNRTCFRGLPEAVQVLWLRRRLRIERCLDRLLQRVRDRLDRPPSLPFERSQATRTATAPLGPLPTRDDLIAHLRSAGRRFARDYWTEGVPLFFPELAATLGPVPDEWAVNKKA